MSDINQMMIEAEMSAYQEDLEQRQAKTDSAVKSLLECGMYKGDTDGIELAIMRMPGFDFDAAQCLLGTIYARLQSKYELDSHEEYESIEYHFKVLGQVLNQAEEPEPDPRAGEDAELDDNRRW